MKEYNKSNIPLAKALRKNMTPWDRKLWYDFLRAYPVRFQRQKAIGNFIVDFYCAKAGLVIELDGGGHYTPDQAEKDLLRTKELETMKLRVMRICNLDIDRNFRGVCEYVDNVVQYSLPQSASLTAPLRGSQRFEHYRRPGNQPATCQFSLTREERRGRSPLQIMTVRPRENVTMRIIPRKEGRGRPSPRATKNRPRSPGGGKRLGFLVITQLRNQRK